MIVQYRKGNLLDATESYIAHGCNCQGAMGSGVAKAIKEKWPEAYTHYQRTWQIALNNGDLLGEIDTGPITKDSKHIINMFTQFDYGRGENKRFVSYDAIDSCFRRAENLIQSSHLGFERAARLAIPKIGAGLGGGDWEIISLIINKATQKLEVVVYEL